MRMKKIYTPPETKLYIVDYEDCLVTYSASILMGGDNEDTMPSIEDWEIETSQGQPFEL